MNTLLALTLIASAYGFVVTILLLIQNARRKEAEVQLKVSRKYKENAEKERDQLAQALKETKEKLDSIKVRRDPKTGRMTSAKRK